MIGIVAVLIAGLITGWHFLLLAPIVYLISLKNRDAGLIAYALFAFYAGSRVETPNIFTYGGAVSTLIFALSMLLLLDECLSGLRFERFETVIGALLFMGFIIPEAFIAGTVFYLAVRLKFDWKVALLTGSMLATLLLFKAILPGLGYTYGQVGVIAGFTILTLVLLLTGRNVKKVRMF